MNFFRNLNECDYSYSLEKLEEIYNKDMDIFDIRILNELDIYLSK